MPENDIVIDGDEFFMNPFSDVCTHCKHLFFEREGRFCRAFPDGTGIPMEIWEARHDHKTPYPGDNGIMFEKL